MITQRAWLIGGVGFCFYLITIVNDLPSFYYALTWLSAGVLGSSLAIAFLSLIGLRCAWRIKPGVVTENFHDDASSGPVVEMQLANAGTLNKTGIIIEIVLRRAGDEATLSRRFLMEALPSGSSLTTTLPLLHLLRGRYTVQEARLIGSDVLGLFAMRRRVPPDIDFETILTAAGGSRAGAANTALSDAKSTPASGREIIVAPTALARRNAALPTYLARGDGGLAQPHALGQGDDIRGTRLYVPGDDLRHVHWKSVARKGQLVVKEFHHTLQEQALVIWDGAADTTWGEKTHQENPRSDAGGPTIQTATGFGLNTCEWGLRLTASLCRALIESRRPCALLRLDAAPLGIGLRDNTRHTFLTMDQVSEVLADARAERRTAFGEALALFRARWTGQGQIFLVSASLAPDLVSAVQQWHLSGASVHVALLNGAAFLEQTRMLRLAKIERTPLQAWRGTTEGEINSIAVTEDHFRAQIHRLRGAGAHVVAVAPRAGERDFIQPLQNALYEMMEKPAAKFSSLPAMLRVE